MNDTLSSGVMMGPGMVTTMEEELSSTGIYRSASDVNIVSDAQIEGNGDIDRVRGCLITTCKSNNVLNCIEKELACKATILAKNTRFPHRLCIL